MLPGVYSVSAEQIKDALNRLRAELELNDLPASTRAAIRAVLSIEDLFFAASALSPEAKVNTETTTS